MTEADNLMKILDRYGKASGQRINHAKSFITFSSQTPRWFRRLLSGALHIRNLTHPGKYLGLPAELGLSKSQSFDSLKQRILTHLKGWKASLLSQAGHGVMIRSVIQALPAYAMDCFKLSKKWINDLNSAMARFWNEVVFQGVSPNPIKVIQSTQHFIKEFSTIAVLPHHGRPQNSSSDSGHIRWTPPEYGWLKINVDGAALSSNLTASVGDVLKTKDETKGSTSWSVPSIVWKYIRTLPLSAKIQNFIWRIFKNSVAVKENLVAKMIPNDRFCPICLKEGETINHVLFDCEFARAVWFATPYGVRTDEGGDSPMHERWKAWLANNQSKEDQVLKITASAVLAWSLWKNRNSTIFQDSCKFPSLVARQAMGLVEEAFTVGGPAQGRLTPQIQQQFVRWISPDGQWVKINCDGSANTVDESMGIGAIARNSKGTILSGFTQGVKNGNAMIAEATAIKSAVELTIRFGWNHTMIESDALVLVNCLKHNQDPPHWDIMAIMADIKALAIKIPHLRFTYVSRMANSFAHKLAAFGQFSGASNDLEAQTLNSHSCRRILTCKDFSGVSN
ncbi:hypothetical protein HHK36_030367 [Tetracentron sinense]|uniref:Uncharacterized protein n=1 Tax=Tetracentron sinense TaxID=13715 RepID=A0A834YCC8_TETSI|nr:hypothetical protein HHK36_030367 [Tetracentron sinense]